MYFAGIPCVSIAGHGQDVSPQRRPVFQTLVGRTSPGLPGDEGNLTFNIYRKFITAVAHYSSTAISIGYCHCYGNQP